MESQDTARLGFESGLTVNDPFPIGRDSPNDVVRFGTRVGGDGKSRKESLRGTGIWWHRGRTGSAATSGGGGGVPPPNRSKPERRDEEGEIRISRSATVTLEESWSTSLNSSHSSEEFLKSVKRPSDAPSLVVRPSTKMGVWVPMGVAGELVLPTDDVGLRGGVIS